MGYTLDFFVDLVEERVDLGGSQFSESILERWYSAHASQQNVVPLEFGSPCPPRSPFFLMTQVVMIKNGSHRSLTKCFISNVERFAFMNRTCLRTIWHIFCVCFSNESPRSLMCLFNVGILTVFRWTCLDYTRLMNGSPVLSEETSSSWKELTSISWERDVFLSSCTVLASSLITGLPVLSRIGFRIGGFDWKLPDSCPTSDRWACSETNFLFHSCFMEIFGGGRGDMKTFSYKTSPVSILTTFGIQ